LNGPSSLYSKWTGYNGILSYPSGTCTYTAPTACANPTTTGPSPTGSGALLAASFLLTILALLL